MTTVKFGNVAPYMQVDRADGVRVAVPAEHLERTVTTINMRDGFDDKDEADLALSTQNDRQLSLIGRQLKGAAQKYAIGVLEIDQIVQAHSGGAPAWITADDKKFQDVLGEWFDCPTEEPTMLLTNGGRDALHSQHLNTAAQPAAFNYMAVSANSTAASASNTTLPGEITTAGGGLLRAQATYAHTGGTNTTTLTKTFTANGSDTLPVTIAKIGVLNASSVGTLGYETLLNATATLTVSGDNVAITHTLTIG